ncbi:hypothetical protein [Breoghania sp.]|uniref:hypothetical protein n=1 Tax=Breoghania sp. TaxID=2065378 RepID=UPI0029CA0EB4|nr:hypothetical protein [Breoghania sp.]
MPEQQKDAMSERLAALSKAIDEKVSHLKEHGELSSRHASYVGDLKERQAELRGKLEGAVHDNHVWSAIKNELDLDISSLFSDFRNWVEYLDTDSGGRKS